MLHLHFNSDTDVSKVLAPEALKMFQFEWGIYHKLVRNNEMQHREIGRLLRQEIDSRFDRPFTFLDLACGDSSLAHTILKDTKVVLYEGIDLSRPALECGAAVMKDVPYEVSLNEEDMVTGVLARRESADLIWCGFSIHHLKREQKQDMLSAIRRALKPGGIFVTADPVCRKGETRADFTGRWHEELRLRFRSLSDEEFDHLWQHISTYDYPEPPQDWIAMGEAAGFSSSRQIYGFPGDLFCAAFLYEA